jgi:hypothetical protein
MPSFQAITGRDTCNGDCEHECGCMCQGGPAVAKRPTCCERNNVIDCNQGRRCPERKPLTLKPNGLVALLRRVRLWK